MTHSDRSGRSPARGGDLPRRPTADPMRYLIPAEELPPGFAGRLESAGPPARARAAATVVLVRPAGGAAEVLLLRRPRRSRFAAGAWVFPGGVVDAGDTVAELAELSAGPPPAWWARRLGLGEAEAGAYLVAALREAWEETGILLAEGGAAGGEGGRRALLAGELSLPEYLRRHGLRLDTADVLYIAHWITPEPEPRRYDTRFFLARVPAASACRLEGEELVESRWIEPAAALAAVHAGEMHLLPPTVHTLRRLAEHPSLDALWAALRDAPVPTYLPRMRAHPEGVIIEF